MTVSTTGTRETDEDAGVPSPKTETESAAETAPGSAAARGTLNTHVRENITDQQRSMTVLGCAQML
jgi:hypothetical protein